MRGPLGHGTSADVDACERLVDHGRRHGNVQQGRKRASPSQADRNDDLVFDQAEANAGFLAHEPTLRTWLPLTLEPDRLTRVGEVW